MLVALAAGSVSVPTWAAEQTFMGRKIVVQTGTYVVEKDTNFRDRPQTEGKSLGMLKAGEVVNLAGRAPGTEWLAVRRNNKPLGFVYSTVLLPIVDGTIFQDVTGELQIGPGHRCGFRIHFIGKTEVAEVPVGTSDYDASVVCERGGTRIRFPAQMFITEAPYDSSSKKRVYQINLDLLDSAHNLGEVFSTTMLFDMDAAQVQFDQVSEPTYATDGPEPASMPAADVPSALSAAIRLALTRWSKIAWDDIFSRAS